MNIDFVKIKDYGKGVLAGVGLVLLSGYIEAGIDTGAWNVRKQYEISTQYDQLWRQAQDLAIKNGDRCCDGSEVEEIFSKRGLARTSDGFNPSVDELGKVIEIYGEKPRQ
jgi:hypothetical protein